MRDEIEHVPLEELADRVLATSVVPYPPGIPMLMPGESTGADDGPYLGYLRALQNWDKRFPGFGHDTHGVENRDGMHFIQCLKRGWEQGVSAAGRKMSLPQATMLVAGNMIGTGIFLLPVNLAQVGSISIYGWLIATAGAAGARPGVRASSASSIRSRAARTPTRAISSARSPASRPTTSTGSATGSATSRSRSRRWAISPSWFRTSTAPPASIIATALVIWLLTFANIMGPRVVGALEAWTMALALIPIVAIALLGWFWFTPRTFQASWNVSGGSDWHAISRAASMALWAYMGIESAAVSAGVIENPRRNVPLATIIGLVLAAVVYMLSSTVIMGIMPNAELQTSHAPFAEVARIAIGADRRDRHQRLRGAQVRRLARRLDAAGGAIGQGRGRRRHVSAGLRPPQPPRRAGRAA